MDIDFDNPKRPEWVEGIDYRPEAIWELRQEVIAMRDEALRQNAFGPAVALTHVVALLHYLIEWQAWEGVL